MINGTTNKVATSINVGTEPYGVAIDSANGNVFIDNSGSSTVSILSHVPKPPAKKYALNFTESNLPSGTAWYVNLTNGMKSGSITGTSYTFNLPNGSYSYSIATPDKIYESPPGSATVDGIPVSMAVTFSKVTFTVTFTESNLTSVTAWYVNITGLPGSGAITGTSYSFSLTNGSYNYTISTSDKIYQAPGGSFAVNGKALPVSVSFSKVKYTATFTESNLSPGSAWYVNITGQPGSGALTGTSYSANLVNGTYAYSIATTDKTYHANAGSITVNGNSLSQPISFSKVTYAVTFTETGLPSLTEWYVNLTNGIKSGVISGTSYSVSLANGTYYYSTATSDKIYQASGGSFAVNGKALPVSVSFSKVKYTVTFTESNLTSGTTWYVNITGQPGSGAITGSSYSFSLTNGSYNYTVQSQGRIYHATPGSFTINGLTTANSVSVSFSEVKYTATFTESNLPSGTAWYVNLTNGMKSGAITGLSYSFSLANGSYIYNTTTTDKTYHANAGLITVNGKNTSQPITFSKSIYMVTFTESNLTSGTAWYVNITGLPGSGAITGTSYSFSLTNGSYNYTISTSDKIYQAPGGSFAVNGKALPVSVSFSKVKYTVTFTESNLPSGTAWYVNLTNGMKSGAITGLSYAFSLTNGSYSYTVQSQGRIYHASPGSFTVNGLTTTNSVSVSFSEVKYTVTFTETGLPSGTAWYVNLSNGMKSGAITGSSYTFNLPNGSYSYSIATSAKFYESPSGSVSVKGNSVSSAVTFSLARYTVTFRESGLPSNTTWYVNLSNGMKSGAISGTSYTFNLTNGTYSYTIGNESGYSFSASSTSISVNGNNLSKTITFSAIKKSPSASGMPSAVLYGAIGGVAAVVLFGSVLAMRKRKI